MADLSLNYWGKAKPSKNGSVGWHLLPYHCLDVAACGAAYLRRASSLRRMLCARLGMTAEQLEGWVAFWLVLHDLGKFATTFQGQRSDILLKLQGRESRHGYSIRHDTLGLVYWSSVLEGEAIGLGWFGPDSVSLMRAIDHWVRAVTGHHGQPPSESVENPWPHFVSPDDHRAIRQFVDHMRELFLADMDWEAPCFVDVDAFEDASRELSWWIAGVAVLADWVGSNQDYFPYRDDEVSLAEYWTQAQKLAADACEAIGVLPVEARQRVTFVELFPALTQPSPLQAWANQVSLHDGPQIHLLEDVTGAGKTEAAMMLTHRLMSAGAADGFFIGLPTMATANAMYGRLSHFYVRLFEGLASLVLANGQRELVEAFAASVLSPGPAEHDQAQGDETASARCTAWLADHNKRALLAPAGVGTIDQALMAVLQGKHQSLRLLGLFRKVLIIDEVHACDAYMQGVLEVLLRAHASAGGSAILLSATLPERMKRALLAAFAAGCRHAPPELPVEADYPLITSWRADQPRQVATRCVETRADVRRTVKIRYVSDQDEVVAGIRRALAAGRCVCWVRNTVADAMAAHALFADELDAEHLMLFHARFTLRDRLDMEARVLDHFGAHSTAEQRRGRLVIATQVAEQSLDADWDWMISDLAPIDRLIQRAGRLQRHRRDAWGNRLADSAEPDGRDQPCLWVLGPVWTQEPGSTWFKDAFPKSVKVYRHHGQLWWTARFMQDGQLSMPADARRLIEGVFAEDVEMPAGLQFTANEAIGAESSEASHAHRNTIKLDVGYVWRGEHWWSDAQTPTRLGEPSANVVLCRWEGDRVVPWSAHEQLRHAWSYSTVRVPERLVAEAVPPEDPQRLQAWEAARLTLPDQGKWSVLLVLERVGGDWVGSAMGKTGDVGKQMTREWIYDGRFGLLARPSGENERG
ncbi:CRISPR-associated helicase Cas3' [Pigmentiphaga sp. H8]|uniref:CRISPR-associated helicase Cas3' n=1 Tax=Pigmentiphaga sp. H8 TaxID=2488560 RepID=UPI000F5B428D|nr:CRISPR-associated helicase Cas3' [Pigmentiphaga sp. H8]AZG07070.1 CRISPR-associated helicase Cas3' [Pigmentiphaga sp. H8]